ncbi:uncharacterized protein [Magallana gigas]|uniref:uncharacterized protein isoform X2 n=1 Tax=Magallana gigas TaxID=29159 RepID=UPI00333E6822
MTMWELLVFLPFVITPGNAQTQVELSVPSSLSLGKAPLTISCRSLKASVINRIQIERKPATGSVYSTLVYVGEGFTPIVRDDELRPRTVATGRVGASKEASLELNLSKDRVNCNDWGYYKCKITYTVGNLSSTATSASVLMNLVVPPSSADPILLLSPSNIPNEDSSSYRYLKGTTIIIGCRAEVVPVTSDGLVYCDVYNATANRGCSTHMTSTSASFTVQDFPVCNVSIGSTNASFITPTSNVTSSPNIPKKINTGEFTTPETKDYTVLVLGCVFTVVAGALFIASVIIYLKARKLRKEAEAVMIRTTYDSVQYNSKSASEYSSLDNLAENTYHRPLEKQDSDGYVMPTSSFKGK